MLLNNGILRTGLRGKKFVDGLFTYEMVFQTLLAFFFYLTAVLSYTSLSNSAFCAEFQALVATYYKAIVST